VAQGRGRGQRTGSFVGKPVGQKLMHTLAKLFADDAFRLAVLRGGEDFKFTGTRVSRPGYVQHH
jgi:hypothetical protein